MASGLEVSYSSGSADTPKVTNTAVDRVFFHPDFDMWFLDNDIALVLVQIPMTFGNESRPVCLSEFTSFREWGDCWVSGWGFTGEWAPQQGGKACG